MYMYVCMYLTVAYI